MSLGVDHRVRISPHNNLIPKHITHIVIMVPTDKGLQREKALYV